MHEHSPSRRAERRANRVAARWDSHPPLAEAVREGPRDWLVCQHVLHDYVLPRFEGLGWHEFIKTRCSGAPPAKALMLCCGKGEVERGMHAAGICASFDGVDISPEAIETCRREAASLDGAFSYWVADLERATLPEQTYDLVFGWMGLHHLRNFSHLYREVRRALRPDGLFIINEYVGPPRFVMTRAAVRLANEWLSLLPPELRREWGGRMRERITSPRAAQVAAWDPSEAVASHRLLPLLERHFTILERIDYGGTVIQQATSDILHNFDHDRPDHRAYLEQLYEMERQALRRGVIESNFAFGDRRGPLVKTFLRRPASLDTGANVQYNPFSEPIPR